MGVLPGGAGDVNTADGLFLISGPATGNQPVSTLDQNDQAAVVEVFKAKEIDNGSSVWSDPTKPLGQVFGGAAGAGGIAGLPGMLGAFFSKLTGTAGPFNSIQSVINAVEQLPLWADLTALQTTISGQISTWTATFTANLTTVGNEVSAGFKSIFDEWFGGTAGTGTATEVSTAIASIKSAVLEGYTVTIFTASNPAWVVPANTVQAIGCVINGGGKGAAGGSGNAVNAVGGVGGSSGGYLSSDLDLTGITPGTSTLAIVVGTAATTNAANGGQSSISFGGTPLLAGAANANGIASAQGLIGTTSTPGQGGKGGSAVSDGTTDGAAYSAGAAGGNSGVATGGAPGGSETKGGNGGAGVSGTAPVVGGGGGGGGGASAHGGAITTAKAGAGGDGGYPGGGSGGGGAAVSGLTRNPGNGGTPGQGLVVILTK